MGYFTDGYTLGTELQQNKSTAEDFRKNLMETLKNGTFDECKEWYNGLYKGMLDYDLFMLEQGFSALKEEAQKGKN